jgi:predicted SprT family Zn-dependent metalloprotease
VDLAAAQAEARELMARHGLANWSFAFDNAKTRAGVCRETRRQIGLSRVLTQLHTAAEVRDTILHEIAHALVGVAHGHDARWRATAVSIGCSGMRCVAEESARPPAPWVGRCPSGHEVLRHRRPSRVQSCARCSRSFDPSSLIEWRYRGRRVPMHPQYVEELRSLVAAPWVRLRLPVSIVETVDGGAPAPVPARTGPREAAVARASHAAGLPSPDHLAVGATVRLAVQGKYADAVGIIEKRGRTRFHVRTAAGVLTVPFAAVVPVEASGT